MAATAARRSMAFILGFGFSLLPNVAPFLAVLAALTQDWRFRREDTYWFLGVVLLGAPLALAGQWAKAAGGIAEILAAWLLYRSFATLPKTLGKNIDPRLLAAGMLTGLATVIAIGATHVDGIQPLAHVFQAVSWDSPPNLFAHSVLTLGLLIAVLVARGPYRMAALTLSALGILFAGSRDAAIAWTVAALLLLLAAPARRVLVRVVEFSLLVVMILLAGGFTSTFGFARLGFLLDTSGANPSPNLLHGTEFPHGDWWFGQGVSVSSGTATLAGSVLTSYTVTKRELDPWRRLQQGVALDPNGVYTLSAWIRPSDAGVVPGLEGWGDDHPSGDSLVLVSKLAQGRWTAQVTGNAKLLGFGKEEASNGWTRGWASFRYTGDHRLYWWVGFSPDERKTIGTSAQVAGMQLARGQGLTSYVPGQATQGLTLASSRLPYWSAAWTAFLQRPLLGRSAMPFSTYYTSTVNGSGRYSEVPSHAHDLLLQVLYQRGVVGLLGLVFLLYALSRSALRRRDVLFLVALGSVLLANVFDYTLFFGGVIYPLAAVAGWRSSATQPARSAADQRARAALVQLTLAAADLAAAGAALALALLLRDGLTGSFGLRPLTGHVPNALLYAFLLWPALSLREGLYPGYGVKAPQELRRGVLASLQAGLLLTAGSVLFARSLPVARSVLVLMVVIALVTVPVARAVAKRVLMRLGVWGRDVVILGGGSTSVRVVAALRKAPLAGLRPVAVFDNDPAKLGAPVGGLRVAGTLAGAQAYAVRSGVSHAIVAMPELSPEALAAVVEQSTSVFRRVQFVPELPGIPTEDVFASELDEMLALEIRGGLYAPGNRLAKRIIDILGGVVLTVLTSPILLVLVIWVRLDSRGPTFHRSERVGQGGSTFRCLKFRTMHVDAEERLSELLASDSDLATEYATYHKLHNDPRITRAGRFLRKTSLDELPQLLNVILGQMSLVGPRPYLAREMPEIGRFADILFRAKPGITGFWQVSARNEVTFEERLNMESHYVRNWSIWWDIILLVQTPGVVLEGRGAK